jgi:oligoendopeptidase F
MKPHYYSPELNYYNYPYAFGQLFGLGLFAQYRKEGAAFLPRYVELLRHTGTGPAADLTARFGIDIRAKEFWAESLRMVGEQVDAYVAMKA